MLSHRVRLAVPVSLALLLVPRPAAAFFEDLCVSKAGKFETCIEPFSACKVKPSVGSACPVELQQATALAARPRPGRSMIHADATYFLAQALGYRADVAYWIAAYDEVTDLTRYAPIDQCGVQASEKNSGRRFITATFNGFQRTNTKTDGPLYHYTLAFSPNGDGTDVHGASGVQAVYPLRFPAPGYPAIDDIYQGTLYNLRQWAMQPTNAPGLLCAAGFTEPNGPSHFSGARCLAGAPIRGTVPVLSSFNFGPKIEAQTGPKLLDNANGPVTVDQLEAWLRDPKRTQGVLWKDAAAPPVPVQLARIGLYLHTLQDTASHATYCGDDAPSPPGGDDSGTYMALEKDGVRLVFGRGCATSPHVAGHVEETGTGDAPLPLRDYTALDATLDELIVFGNAVAKPNGWLATPDLLPPDVAGGKSARGQSAAELETLLVGALVSGRPGTRGERYRSGVVTAPLQVIDPVERLHKMNAAIGDYSKQLGVPLEPMPGNSTNANDKSACFQVNKEK
ncbi:MAG: hypothetical protein JST54_06320 [Deltaproteobacteria bacterium]|nr:hypothetical protein [Deltaproteobacteria bacterium]